MSAFPADDRRRADSAKKVILDLLLHAPREDWWTLSQLAFSGGCSEAGASARLRELRADGWNVERRKRPGGLREYRVNGRLPLEPAKKKPRDSELDALRARIERLEAELAVLSTSTTHPGLAGVATGSGPERGLIDHDPAVAAESRDSFSEEGQR